MKRKRKYRLCWKYADDIWGHIVRKARYDYMWTVWARYGYWGKVYTQVERRVREQCASLKVSQAYKAWSTGLRNVRDRRVKYINHPKLFKYTKKEREKELWVMWGNDKIIGKLLKKLERIERRILRAARLSAFGGCLFRDMCTLKQIGWSFDLLARYRVDRIVRYLGWAVMRRVAQRANKEFYLRINKVRRQRRMTPEKEKHKLERFYGGIRTPEKLERYAKLESQHEKGHSVQSNRERFIGLLERRLYVVIYRLHFAGTLEGAKEIIKRGYVTVNSVITTEIDHIVGVGEKVQVVEAQFEDLFAKFMSRFRKGYVRCIPRYFEVNYKFLAGVLIKKPRLIDIPRLRKIISRKTGIVRSKYRKPYRRFRIGRERAKARAGVTFKIKKVQVA